MVFSAAKDRKTHKRGSVLVTVLSLVSTRTFWRGCLHPHETKGGWCRRVVNVFKGENGGERNRREREVRGGGREGEKEREKREKKKKKAKRRY